MQTIDLGNISIGSEDVGEPGQDAASCPVCPTAASPLPEGIIQERVTVEAVRPSPEATGSRRESECPSHTEKGDIHFEKCEDYKRCHLGDTVIDGQGRILDLTLRLINVCPGKRVAVGVTLGEIDPRGNEHPRGMKTFTVSAHHHGCCTDIPVETIRFILPEDSCTNGTGGLCGSGRHFVAKVSAHYIDFSPSVASL